MKKVLYCQAGDKSSTTLIFGEQQLFIKITSKTYCSEINRTLEALDIDLQDIPLDTLLSIEYPFEFSLHQPKFLYALKNLQIYSEIMDIYVDKSSFGINEYSNLKKQELISFIVDPLSEEEIKEFLQEDELEIIDIYSTNYSMR